MVLLAQEGYIVPQSMQYITGTTQTHHKTMQQCLPRWLSAHRPERSAGEAGVQSSRRPVDFVFGFQGRML